MKITKWIGAFLIIVLWGCAPASYKKAQEAYENGEDDLALQHVIESLKEKPDYKPAIKLLEQIYDDVVDSHRKQIATLKKNKKKKDRWTEIVEHENQIKNFNKEIKLLTRRNIEFEINIKSNKKSLEMALDSAAYYSFQYGQAAMENLDKESMREAARYFRYVMDYRGENYPEAEDLYNECREKGTVRIVVDKLSGDKSGRIHGAIISAMQEDKDAMEFISFVTREDLDRLNREREESLDAEYIEGSGAEIGQLLGAQYVVVGTVGKMVCSETPEVQRGERVVTDKRKTGRKNCKQKESGEEVCKDEYKTFEATVTTDTLIRKASISGTIKMLDASSSEIKKTSDIREVVVSTTEKSKCRGDEGACKKAKFKLSGSLLPCQELYDQLVEKFAQKATEGLSAYTKQL